VELGEWPQLHKAHHHCEEAQQHPQREQRELQHGQHAKHDPGGGHDEEEGHLNAVAGHLGLYEVLVGLLEQLVQGRGPGRCVMMRRRCSRRCSLQTSCSCQTAPPPRG